jgi:hypothetical protein
MFGLGVANHAVQKQPGLAPVALHRALGDAAQLRDFPEREAAEKMEVDEIRQLGVDVAERLERLTDLFDIVGRRRVGNRRGVVRSSR